jgi:hypothetical protein
MLIEKLSPRSSLGLNTRFEAAARVRVQLQKLRLDHIEFLGTFGRRVTARTQIILLALL